MRDQGREIQEDTKIELYEEWPKWKETKSRLRVAINCWYF